MNEHKDKVQIEDRYVLLDALLILFYGLEMMVVNECLSKLFWFDLEEKIHHQWWIAKKRGLKKTYASLLGLIQRGGTREAPPPPHPPNR